MQHQDSETERHTLKQRVEQLTRLQQESEQKNTTLQLTVSSLFIYLLLCKRQTLLC